MVGYNLKKLVEFGKQMDSLYSGPIYPRVKIEMSYFYMLCMDDDAIEAMQDKIAIEMLGLMFIYYRSDDKSFEELATDTISHILNRALYKQSSYRGALARPDKETIWKLLAIKEVTIGNLAEALTLLMIEKNKDLEEFISDTDKVACFIRNNFLINSGLSISTERLADAC
jgi:hypothetical protein